MFLPIVKCQVKANTVVCRAYLVIRKKVYRQQASQKNSSHSQSPMILSRREAKTLLSSKFLVDNRASEERVEKSRILKNCGSEGGRSRI